MQVREGEMIGVPARHRACHVIVVVRVPASLISASDSQSVDLGHPRLPPVVGTQAQGGVSRGRHTETLQHGTRGVTVE